MDAQLWDAQRKTLDPTIFKPKQYECTFTVAAAANNKASGLVTLDDRPFFLERVTHIRKDTADDTIGQNGNYTLQLWDSQRAYNDAPAMASLLYGNSFRGNRGLAFPVRVWLPASETLRIDCECFDYPGEAIASIMQIVFHGFERRWQDE